MSDAAPKTIAVQKVIDDVMRRQRGRLLSGLITRLGDFQLAEDALQDAVVSALGHWVRAGVPDNPLAWLMKVGLNKGIDRFRARAKEQVSIAAFDVEDTTSHIDAPDIPDDRLRLIFTCCHPALEEKSRVALTLRTVCNLTTREIAAGFLDTEQTMGQRLSRAKAKIAAKGIRFSVPGPEHWAVRLDTVLSTIHLIFTTGYVNEDESPRDLCREGIFLARLLRELRPMDSEIDGALALMLLTEARRGARTSVLGALVPVDAQDRSKWDRDLIAEAQTLLVEALSRRAPGPFQIKAALADCHMAAPSPDWVQMSLLYQSLWSFEPTDVVALNWAVVLAELGEVSMAFAKVEALEASLSQFQPWHAARADLLTRLGQTDLARQAYDVAIDLAPNRSTRLFLEAKRAELEFG